jgi:hypothetical protein
MRFAHVKENTMKEIHIIVEWELDSDMKIVPGLKDNLI